MPPNVLWICTDQQRWDTLGCYGNEFVETPNIDRLADSGVRFDNAYCQNPICSPSRGSFMTGRYPRTVGVRQNGQPIPDEETLVTALLADAGYTCGLSGKCHLSPVKSDSRPMMERRIDDGYAEFHWSHDPGSNWSTNAYRHWLRRHDLAFNRELYGDSDYVETSVPAEFHQTTWCVERAVEFVEANAEFDEPWLFSVNIFDPHNPFDPPEAYLQRYLDDLDSIPLPNHTVGERENKPTFQRYPRGARNYPIDEMDERDHRIVRAAYWAMIDLIDDQVGRLLDVLERTNQRENTIIIFTSDHGEMLGDHGIYLKGPYFYEPAVRVPLVVDGPGVESGIEHDALIELIDLAPTLLEAAGVDLDPGMQGESLWPLLANERDDHREAVYCEYYNEHYHEYYDTEPEIEAHATMVRTDRYKLVNIHNRPEGELYDLAEDPDETRNRWHDNAYRDVKTQLLVTLSDRMASTVDPLPEREARV